MTKNKRLGVSVFVVILTIIMLLSVVFTFSISYMFSTEGMSGKLFGKYIYIMETADMEPEIEKGAAVISDQNGITVLVEGNVILFKNGTRENVMRIRRMVHNTDGTIYQVSPDADPQNTIEISKEKVIAKCVTEGKNLGSIISFLSSLPGIILCLIFPCIILLAMLIFYVIRYKKSDVGNIDGETDLYNDEDEDYEFKGFNGHSVKSMSSSPLFNPESDINPGDDFERKKSSIAQNFSRKPGAQPKRPARNKQSEAPKAAVEKFKAAVEEKPHVPVTRKSTLIPENENPVRNEKLAAIKNALKKHDNKDLSNNEKNTDNNEQTDKTVLFQSVEFPRIEKPEKKNAPPVNNKPSSKSENINSIDDLIKALEEEKKKL